MSQKNSIATGSKKVETNLNQPVFRRSGTYVVDKKDQNTASSSVQIDSENMLIPTQKKTLINQKATNTHSKLTRIQSLPVKSQPGSADSQKSNFNSMDTSMSKPSNMQTRTSNNNLLLIREKKRAELKDQPLNATTMPNKSIDLILKNARKSGQLNLSDFGLIEIPAQVWRINAQDAVAANKSASIDNDENDFKWWDQIDLNKLIAASNKIKIIPKDVQHLSTLVTLDVI